jgi:hypothetical protein
MGNCFSKREEARLLFLVFNNNNPEKKNGCHALENLRCFCHLEKNKVDFYRVPTKSFPRVQIKRRTIALSM